MAANSGLITGFSVLDEPAFPPGLDAVSYCDGTPVPDAGLSRQAPPTPAPALPVTIGKVKVVVSPSAAEVPTSLAFPFRSEGRCARPSFFEVHLKGDVQQKKPCVSAGAFACRFQKAGAYRMMLNRCTVLRPFTVMFTRYTPLAMSPGSCRMVLKRSPVLPNSWVKTCLP